MEKKSKKINIKSFIQSRSKTKVICTIGPSTYEVNSIIKLIKSGMSIARLNLSHGNEKDHITYVKNIREASKQTGIIIGILGDLPGPKYRIGNIENDTYLANGGDFTLTNKKIKGNKNIAQVWPSGLSNDLDSKSKILIDDGKVVLKVKKIHNGDIFCKVETPGYIVSNKSVSAPGHTSTLNYFTKETKKAIEFVNRADVNFVGASYVRLSLIHI